MFFCYRKNALKCIFTSLLIAKKNFHPMEVHLIVLSIHMNWHTDLLVM